MPECVEMPAPVMHTSREAVRTWAASAANSDSASAGAAGASERSCRTAIVALQIAAADKGAIIVAERMAAGPSIVQRRARPAEPPTRAEARVSELSARVRLAERLPGTATEVRQYGACFSPSGSSDGISFDKQKG
jgi:hypothetical protein